VAGLSRDDEAALKAATGYGGSRQRRTQLDPGESDRYHPHFGNTIVSCERGDLRLSVDGVLIYDDSGVREVPVPLAPAAKSKTIDELYDAVVHGRPVLHDARWGKATLEVCLAMRHSAQAQAEVPLAFQVPTPDG
jgi:phthalate 4,5-cis-dihydrodiol dehydrogenase